MTNRVYCRWCGYEIADSSLGDLCPTCRQKNRRTEVKHHKPRPSSPDGIIYMVRCVDNGRVKIGHTKRDIEIRITDLQNQNGGDVELWDMFKGNVRQERMLHRVFDKFRHHGEWFDLPKNANETAKYALINFPEDYGL